MNICPVFVDETGVLSASLSEQPVYGIGLLVVPRPQDVTDSFYKLHFNFLRERTTLRRRLRRDMLFSPNPPSVTELNQLMWSSRHHEYKFSEVTRFNIQQYIDLLNLYFSYPELEFHCLLMDRTESDYSLSRWGNDVWKAYASLAKDLLDRRLNRDVFAILDLQAKPDYSQDYIEEILCTIPTVRGCLRATSDMSVFLQLADVLLGCVQFDWKDQRNYYGTMSRRAAEKRELASFLKARLGVLESEPVLPDGLNFKRWTKSSTFSVWKRKW